MRIVSWNCNGNFRNKFDNILKLDADIYIIQECENPDKNIERLKSVTNGKIDEFNKYRSFAKNYLWYGAGLGDDKGIGVFAKDGIKLENLKWNNYGLRYFLPFRVNDEFNILGVWTGRPYIEEFYVYLQIYKKVIDNEMILIGDFNSNSCWDKEHRERSHSKVVEQLSGLGLQSAYHYQTGEEHGKESLATFFGARNEKKPYHIDYCFLNPNRLIKIDIPKNENWVQKGNPKMSDHVPLVVDIY